MELIVNLIAAVPAPLLWSGGLKLLWATLATLTVIGVSVWLDKRAGLRFKEVVNDIREENSLGDYLGKRWLGLCIIFGAVFAFA